MHRLRGRRVELAVPHARARGHVLQLAGPDNGAGAQAVLVLQLARQDVGQNLHVLVAVHAEAAARLHAILVQHAQRPKAHVSFIIIVREGEGVIGIQPAVVGVAPVLSATHSQHGSPS